MTDHVDVIVVGAGLSGIGAVAHLQDRCPDLTWTILEAREAVGGTWDLFRYPGVRSDSDMFTLGYAFRPWTSTRPSPAAPRSAPTSPTPPVSAGSTGRCGSGTG